MTSTLAAIIPVYNRPALVLEALATVAAQTRRPEAVIIVDDGSTDGTAAAVERWLATRGAGLKGRLIRQSNAGPGAARNRGAAEAGAARCLAFLDSDDAWPVDYLARMERAMAPGIVAASCDQLTVDAVTGRSERRTYPWLSSRTDARATAALLRHGPPGTPNTVFLASTFHETGGYDPALLYGEDHHLMLKLSLRGKWAYVPGDPVTVRKENRDAAGAADQLSRTVADRRHQLARMLQRFIDEEGGREAVPARLWRPRLSRQWMHAGRQLAAMGRGAEAADCFRRAVEANPWSLAARWNALRRG